MDLGRVSTDAIEQQLMADEQSIARLRARQMVLLEELDIRQIATADGSRSLSEWVASRLDVSPDTAKPLVRTMRRLQERPDLQQAVATGRVSFDRVDALSRILEDVGLMEWADVPGVRREAAKRARITTEQETRSAAEQYLAMQPSLDESRWRLWGELDGYSGAVVDKALTKAADELPDLPDGSRGSQGWRRATALVGCLTADEAPPAEVAVIVEARDAAPSNGEAGVTLEAGPRVGRQALERILCDANTGVVARTEDGRFMEYGRRHRTAPPAMRRALLAKYQHRCGADGCESRHRLQVHHLTPWSEGGETNQDEVVLLCWFHHQVVVHERGYEVYFHPEHGRIRFRKPERAPGRRRTT